MLEIKRRDFIKGSAALAGAASVAGSPVLNTLTKAVAEPVDGNGENPTVEWFPTVCQGCTTWCAVEVGIQDLDGVKRAVQVRGHKRIGEATNGRYTGGFACPRSILALQEVYDPDRLKVPMRRTNPKKGRGIDPGFEPITWDQAITDIATRMLRLRGTTPENSQSHTLALFRGRYTDANALIYSILPTIFGSPNYVSHSTMCAEAEKYAYFNAMNRFGYCDYDIDNTKFLLLWSVDPTQSNRQVPAMINQFGELAARGVKVATVDPKLTSAASKSDWWLPVKPGTDSALALAMAHVILVNGAWNKSFVGDFTDGVNKFVAGQAVNPADFVELGTAGLVTWWNTEVFDRTPEWAEAETGVEAATIEAVALAFAAAGQDGEVISWVGPGMTMQPRGVYGGWAAAALNGLMGSFDHKGGVLAEAYNASLPSGRGSLLGNHGDFTDAIKTSGTGKQRVWYFENTANNSAPLAEPQFTTGNPGGGRATNRIADAINAGKPYPINMIISYWSNFAFSAPGSARWESALEKVPFMVDLGTNPSESAWYADIVLPANHHMFENWSRMGTHQRGVLHSTIQQEMITKPWDSKCAETEFVWLLAKKMYELGNEVGGEFEGYPGTALLWNFLNQAGFSDPTTGALATTAAEFNLACARRLLVGGIADQTAAAAKWEKLITGEEGYWAERDDATYFVSGRGPRWRYAVTGTGTSFGTNSGKVELYYATSKLRGQINTHKTNHASPAAGGPYTDAQIFTALNYPAAAAGREDANGDPVDASVYGFMPHWEAPDILGDPAEYPFEYVDYKSRLNREGRSANTLWYHEFKSNDPGDERHRDVVLMNPADVGALGLKDGQAVRVVSPTSGKVGERCHVKAFPGVRPGTVAKSFGQGHWAYGRQASNVFGEVGRGASSNALLPPAMERFTGSAARNGSTRVKVIPA